LLVSKNSLLFMFSGKYLYSCRNKGFHNKTPNFHNKTPKSGDPKPKFKVRLKNKRLRLTNCSLLATREWGKFKMAAKRCVPAGEADGVPGILTVPLVEVSSVYGWLLSTTTGWEESRPLWESVATSSSSVTHSSSSMSATCGRREERSDWLWLTSAEGFSS